MTNSQESNSFLGFLKELTAPIALFIGITLFMLEFREKIDLFSIKLSSALIPLFCLTWLIYVWRKKTGSDKKNDFTHKKIIRIGSVLAFILSLFPIYFVIISSLPLTIKFQINNNTKDTLDIRYLNSYNILTIAPNSFEYTVTSGTLTVKNKTKKDLTIMPNSTEYYVGQFEDQTKLKSYLTGDYWISLDIRTNKNTWINCEKMLHLTRETIDGSNLILNYKNEENNNNAL